MLPFIAISWSIPVGTCPRIYPAVRIVDGVDIAVNSANPTHVATALSAQPAGARALILTDNSFSSWPKNSFSLATDGITYGPWPSPTMAPANNAIFLAAVKAAGGRIDGVFMDVENIYGTYSNTSAGYAAIEADPHFPVVSAALGFSDLVTNLDTSSGYRPNHDKKMIYDNYGEHVVNNGFAIGLLSPLESNFPGALLCNFNSSLIDISIPQPDLNGYENWYDNSCGNCQAPVCYGLVSDGPNINTSLGQTADWTDPASALVLCLNRVRAGAGTNKPPVTPWVQQKDFTGTPLTNSDIWDEEIRHLLLHAMKTGVLLYFNSAPVDDTGLNGILVETAEFCGNSVPIQLLTTNQILYSNTGYDTIISVAVLDSGVVAGRVTFGAGTTSTVVSLPGFNPQTVTKDSGGVGAWFTLTPAYNVIETAQAGKWGNPGTWVGGEVPDITKVAKLLHQITVDAEYSVGGIDPTSTGCLLSLGAGVSGFRIIIGGEEVCYFAKGINVFG